MFLDLYNRQCYLNFNVLDETLPSVFADIREDSMLQWILDNTAGGTFCKRSDKEIKLTPGKEVDLRHQSVYFLFSIDMPP